MKGLANYWLWKVNDQSVQLAANVFIVYLCNALKTQVADEDRLATLAFASITVYTPQM